MKHALLFALALPTLFSLGGGPASPTAPDPTADEQAVRATIEHYVLAFYKAEPERLQKALSPDVKKMGYWMNPEEGQYSPALHMTFQQATDLATKWNAAGQQGQDLPYEITLFEVCDKTAAAKVTAKWGQDYFHLAKDGDAWRIHHVIWQSAPRK